jgi:hypothetical protein
LRNELLFLSASLLVSLAVGELALLFLPKFTPEPRAYPGREANLPHHYLVPDPELGWRMRPDLEFVHETDEYRVTYRSNAQGFRDERSSAPAPEDRTIAIVGDSFSFGYGVAFDQTFGALLEASLPATAVYNFALPGYGVDQIWISERKRALPLKPVLLIVAFISDDFSRSLTAHRYNMGLNKPAFELEGGVLRPQTPGKGQPEWLWYVLNHSRLWAGVRQVLRLVGHHYPIGEWWQLNRAILDAIRADCHAAGTRVLFVYLFTAGHRPFPALAGYMQATSADFIDLGSRPTPPGRVLTFPEDRHPNPDGHRYVAEAILDWIRREMPELAAPPAREAQATPAR